MNMRTIEISPVVYDRLARDAEVFGMSFSDVVERLLDSADRNVGKRTGVPSFLRDGQTFGRGPKQMDYTRYVFEGRDYPKRQLVLAVIKHHVAQHPTLTMEELQQQFPRKTEGSWGVFREKREIEEARASGRYKDPERRFFMGSGEPVKLSDYTIVVCGEWGTHNIGKFIARARSLGYTITPTKR